MRQESSSEFLVTISYLYDLPFRRLASSSSGVALRKSKGSRFFVAAWTLD
jgi:hypothetical protein